MRLAREYSSGQSLYRPLAVVMAWAGLIMEAAMLVYILEGVSMSTKYTGTDKGLFSQVQTQASFAELVI